MCGSRRRPRDPDIDLGPTIEYTRWHNNSKLKYFEWAALVGKRS